MMMEPTLHNIRIKTEKLIERVREQRTHHVEQYVEALEGYRRQLVVGIRELESFAASKDRFSDDDWDELRNRLRELAKMEPPPDHREDYSRVLDALEAREDEEVILDGVEFARLWRDEWEWKDHFVTNTSRYLA